jgi:hypothetical protein
MNFKFSSSMSGMVLYCLILFVLSCRIHTSYVLFFQPVSLRGYQFQNWRRVKLSVNDRGDKDETYACIGLHLCVLRGGPTCAFAFCSQTIVLS